MGYPKPISLLAYFAADRGFQNGDVAPVTLIEPLYYDDYRRNKRVLTFNVVIGSQLIVEDAVSTIARSLAAGAKF